MFGAQFSFSICLKCHEQLIGVPAIVHLLAINTKQLYEGENTTEKLQTQAEAPDSTK